MKQRRVLDRLITIGSFYFISSNMTAQNISLPVLAAGDSIIILSSVKVNTGTIIISKQHTISGTNFSNVLSNDPKTSAAGDPTVTMVLDALPVTLSGIRAFLQNPGVQVEWKTEQEYNMSWYEVERSKNGRDFVGIGIESSKGNSATPVDYSFYDGNPFNAINYYRIKSVENTGDINFSRIVKINFMIKGFALSCYPNPLIEGKLTLQSANLVKGSYEITITDITGRKVFGTSLDHPGGAVNKSIFLPKALATGNYQVNLKGGIVNGYCQLIKL